MLAVTRRTIKKANRHSQRPRHFPVVAPKELNAIGFLISNAPAQSSYIDYYVSVAISQSLLVGFRPRRLDAQSKYEDVNITLKKCFLIPYAFIKKLI